MGKIAILPYLAKTEHGSVVGVASVLIIHQQQLAGHDKVSEHRYLADNDPYQHGVQVKGPFTTSGSPC